MRLLRGIRGRTARRVRAFADILHPPRMEDHPTHDYVLHTVHRARLEGKVALVTGGGGSIGSAIALRMAAEGATVGLAGRTLSVLEAAVERISNAGVPPERLVTLQMDVTDERSVAAGVERLVEQCGHLEILVNNAGGSARGRVAPLAEQDDEVLQSIVDLNLLGAMRCCKYAIPHLTRGQGRIVNFGSTVGFAGQKNYAEYSAAKSGLIGLTKSLAIELGESGATVNMVTPGWVWRNPFDGQAHHPSDKTVLGRFGSADEVAGLVAYICSPEAGFLTGNDIRIDGGRTLGLLGE